MKKLTILELGAVAGGTGGNATMLDPAFAQTATEFRAIGGHTQPPPVRSPWADGDNDGALPGPRWIPPGGFGRGPLLPVEQLPLVPLVLD